MHSRRRKIQLISLFLVGVFQLAHAGTATAVNGLYYTGVNNSSTPQNSGKDGHWDVTYAYASGVADNPNYQGDAYVVANYSNDSAWVDSSVARWIVPPGASGQYNLPGNGTTGANVGAYVYTLKFTIAGNDIGSVVTNRVSITLTLAADDNASVYVNPTLNTNGSINTASSRLGGTVSSAWANTRTITLQNYADASGDDNTTFKIGDNYLVIQVDNTNGVSGASGSTAANASGLLVYQVGSAIRISPNPVPEAGTWLPLAVAGGLFAWFRFRSKKHNLPAAM